MKKAIIAGLALTLLFLFSCEKKQEAEPDNPYGNGPKTQVPAALRGNWMYGNFSMTEYWSQQPESYLGNAFEMAIAFKFHQDGSYEQYFTSKTISGGQVTYHQSVTKGTVEINEAAKTIVTHAAGAHYRQTKNGTVTEDRDLADSELNKETRYNYECGTKSNGARELKLTLQGTTDPLSFLEVF